MSSGCYANNVWTNTCMLIRFFAKDSFTKTDSFNSGAMSDVWVIVSVWEIISLALASTTTLAHPLCISKLYSLLKNLASWSPYILSWYQWSSPTTYQRQLVVNLLTTTSPFLPPYPPTLTRLLPDWSLPLYQKLTNTQFGSLNNILFFDFLHSFDCLYVLPSQLFACLLVCFLACLFASQPPFLLWD